MEPTTASKHLADHIQNLGHEHTFSFAIDKHPQSPNSWHIESQLGEEACIESYGKSYTTKDRFTLGYSNENSNWYDATLTVSYAYHPQDDGVDAEPDAVYSPYVYVTYHLFNEVDDRINHRDKKTMHRETILHIEDSDSAIPIEDVKDAISEAKEFIMSETEVLGSDRREKIKTEAEMRWDEDAEEYVAPDDDSQQMLVGF